MIKMIADWFQRYFSDPEAVVLFLTLFFATVILVLFGRILTPIIVSLIISMLLLKAADYLVLLKIPRKLAVFIVYLTFLSLMIVALLGLWPLLSIQLANLFTDFPNKITRLQDLVAHLPDQFPKYISNDLIQASGSQIHQGLVRFGQIAFSATWTSIAGIAIFLIYFIMVPFLVYFFMMDKDEIMNWLAPLLPKHNHLVIKVWTEVQEQVGRYLLGNLIDVIVFGGICFAFFIFMGLPYAALLAALVGISVIIPYLGAIIISIPVLIVAFLQFGWSVDFAYFAAGFLILINLNGNILMPLLFSGVISLHPVAIIIALIFFGGIWGVWGVIFAIPLASLIKAVLNAWPRSLQVESRHDVTLG